MIAVPKFSDEGDAKITGGGVTVTLTWGETAVLLDESDADAVMTCVPREAVLVSQATE